MSQSRRSFFKTVGLGGVGLSTSLLVERGSEALAFPAPIEAGDEGIIRLSSNENNRGPGQKVRDAIHANVTTRMGRGYPPDNTNDLVDAIAAKYSVDRTSVIVGTGSGPILEAAARAFTSADKWLVTAAPTYTTCEQMAKRNGAQVKAIHIDAKNLLDLDGMAAAAKGAGLVYICNPNNPTGTVHPAAAIEKFVRQVKQASPATAILIDEAYIDYAHDPNVKTAAPLAVQLPGVFITRSFSKAHGMAGLRLGYAIGQPDTLKAMTNIWQLGSLNTLSAAAGVASLKDTQHIADEIAENARIREFTTKAFKDMGYVVADSHANCLFIEIKRPAAEFRDACAKMNVQVGRDFPPMEKTWARITLGTMEEMQKSVEVFRRVLSTKSTSAGQ